MNNDLIFDIPTVEVSYSSGGQKYGFHVRGLSDEDLLILVRDHQEQIKVAFAKLESMNADMGADMSNADITAFGTVLLEVVPELVAQLIALAADKPDKASVSMVRRMPAPLRLRALEMIWQLTVVDTGGLGPFLDLVLRLTRSLRSGADQAKATISQVSSTGG